MSHCHCHGENCILFFHHCEPIVLQRYLHQRGLELKKMPGLRFCASKVVMFGRGMPFFSHFSSTCYGPQPDGCQPFVCFFDSKNINDLPSTTFALWHDTGSTLHSCRRAFCRCGLGPTFENQRPEP